MASANERGFEPDSGRPISGGDGQRPTNIRWVIFILACLTSFFTYVHRYSWGVARPYLKEEYALSDADLGWLDAAFNLTYALFQFPGGWAGDLLGPRLIIPLACVLWSLMSVAPALVGGFGRLLAVRLIFGVTQAPSYPNLGKVTHSWFPLSVRTSVQGMVASLSGRAGAGFAPMIMATLLIGLLGFRWQTSLYILASVGLLHAALFWMLFRNRPSEHPRVNRAERELIEAGDTTGGPSAKHRFHWTLPNLVNLHLFFCVSFLAAFADNLFVFWMPSYLKEAKGLGDVEMGLFASLPLWGGAAGGLVGGILNDVMIRVTGNRRVARSAVAAGGMLMAAVLMTASMQAADGRVVMAILFCCKFFSDMHQPTWWGTVTDIGGAAAGRVFGIVNMFGSLGATAAGPVMGYVKQDFGYETLFYFVAGVYLLTALFWISVNCTRLLVVRVEETAAGRVE